MQIPVTDTISIPVSDTIRKDTVQKEFFIGKIIPVDSSGKSFPDTLSSSDGVYAKAYTSFLRVPGDPIGAASFNNDYAFGVLTVSLVMLALLIIIGRKILGNIISTLSIKQPFTLPAQSGMGVFSWAPVLVNLFSIVSTSLFVVLGAVTTGLMGPLPGIETIKFVTILFASLSVGLLARHLVCNITGSVSGEKEVFREYISVITAGWFLSGLSFFCISLLILFTKIIRPDLFIMAGAGIFALLYFYRIIRLLVIFLRRRVTILYFILYLCALEVLPVLILLKLLGAF
jgi:hypothetical protein